MCKKCAGMDYKHYKILPKDTNEVLKNEDIPFTPTVYQTPKQIPDVSKISAESIKLYRY